MADAIQSELFAYLAAFVALLLLASATHKLLASQRLKASIVALTGLPSAFGGTAWVLTITAEALAAGAILNPATRALGALVAAGLWGLYAALILRAIAAGRRDVDCGCTLGSDSGSLSGHDAARGLLLALMAAALAVGSSTSTPLVTGLTDLLGGAALLALYLAIDQLVLLADGAKHA